MLHLEVELMSKVSPQKTGGKLCMNVTPVGVADSQ